MIIANDGYVRMSGLHIHHAFHNILLDANGDVQMKRYVMMDDVFIYHAHMFFPFVYHVGRYPQSNVNLD
jgi:hypothetical protein